MELLLAVVQDADAPRLLNRLNRLGIRATKLASTGGFLRAGNTTFLFGVEEDERWRVIDAIRRECRTRTEQTVLASEAVQVVDVTVGGAVVFVLRVEEFLRT